MKKLFLALITSLMFVAGTAHALLPQYGFFGGTPTEFTSANTYGLLDDGVVATGMKIEYTGEFAGFGFFDPVQVTFTTLENTIPLAQGVAGITNSPPGRIFTNDDSALTVSPLQGAYYMWVTDFVVTDSDEDSWMLGVTRLANDPLAADPSWSLIERTNNSFLAIFEFDQGNPDQGMWAFEVSMPVMSPVPEPETYAMLLIGLGFVAFAVRKRRYEKESLRFVPLGA